MDNSTDSGMPDEDMVILSLDNPVLRSYLFACALLLLKILLMPLLIARYRFGRGIFISPEDVPMAKVVLGKGQVSYDDPDLERVRRAHTNDIENIPIFMAIGFCYIFTMPAPLTAAILYYLYTGCRVLHTFVYAVFVIPQPARLVCYIVGVFISLYMAIMVLIKIPPM